ncbi:MAG TPA: ERCC4 domain-containing protein [archaeon]|nr:ERCC4 domain-containing protein [archaeon]
MGSENLDHQQGQEVEVKNVFIQKTLPAGKITVFVDHRENNMVPNHIRDLGAVVILKQLKVADFICSDRVAIEKKTCSDFLQSIINQRIFKQIEEISNSFDRPVLLLEGNPEMLFFERQVHPNTIRGVLSSIAIDYKVPILWTSNSKETAGMIYWIAKREQDHEKRGIQIRAKTRTETLQDQQEFILAGLPAVSNVLSKRLLEHFGSVKKIFNAKQEKLMKVEGIGEEKAKKIWELLNSKYEKD